MKKPLDGKLFTAITIFLDQDTLKKHSLKFHIKSDGIYTGEPNVLLDNDAFMKGYFASLMPYFAQSGKLTSPEKWMQKRRLEMAYFLISQKRIKPSDVYLEVGFQNLSHFSRVFKKEFKINASALQGKANTLT